MIELHDKYLKYVTECFNNSSLFHKALKEAFEAYCNKAVAGSTSAELMANYCDKLLGKSSGEKLSDEVSGGWLQRHLTPVSSCPAINTLVLVAVGVKGGVSAWHSPVSDIYA